MIASKMSVLLILTFLASLQLKADEYHYRDVLIGERAAGLAGAYVAISDDPSGIYYNPAGIVYSMENYISGSANGYNTVTKTYKDVWTGENYVYQSESLVPTFFGFTQSLSRKDKWGFAVIVPNSDLLDQDERFRTPASGTEELQRRLFWQDVTYMFGVAYSREMAKSFTMGLSLFGFYRNKKLIDNQWVNYTTASDVFRNTHISKKAYGIIPKLGIQWMPSGKLSIGATVSKPFNAFGEGTERVYIPLTEASIGGMDCRTFSTGTKVCENNDPYYGIAAPITATLGAAYFVSKRFLLTGDFEYNTGDDAFKAGYELQPVFNWSLGTEYYTSDAFALRFGVYSNNANTPSLEDGVTGQPENVNLIGGTASFSLYNSGSSLTLGASYAQGTGKGDAAGSGTLQDLEQMSMTLFLMGSYQL